MHSPWKRLWKKSQITEFTYIHSIKYNVLLPTYIHVNFTDESFIFLHYVHVYSRERRYYIGLAVEIYSYI